MSNASQSVKSWMEMSRWICRTIRDEFCIDEKTLIKTADLETDLGLSSEQVEEILGMISAGFDVQFPDRILDEVVNLEQIELTASWLAGLYKRPAFLSEPLAQRCQALNKRAA